MTDFSIISSDVSGNHGLSLTSAQLLDSVCRSAPLSVSPRREGQSSNLR